MSNVVFVNITAWMTDQVVDWLKGEPCPCFYFLPGSFLILPNTAGLMNVGQRDRQTRPVLSNTVIIVAYKVSHALWKVI